MLEQSYWGKTIQRYTKHCNNLRNENTNQIYFVHFNVFDILGIENNRFYAPITLMNAKVLRKRGQMKYKIYNFKLLQENILWFLKQYKVIGMCFNKTRSHMIQLFLKTYHCDHIIITNEDSLECIMNQRYMTIIKREFIINIIDCWNDVNNP